MTFEQIEEEINSSGLKVGHLGAKGDPTAGHTVTCKHIEILRASPESELTWVSRYVLEGGEFEGEIVDVRTCPPCTRREATTVKEGFTLLYRVPWPMFAGSDIQKSIRKSIADGDELVVRSERGRQVMKDVLESN